MWKKARSCTGYALARMARCCFESIPTSVPLFRCATFWHGGVHQWVTRERRKIRYKDELQRRLRAYIFRKANVLPCNAWVEVGSARCLSLREG